MYQRAELEPVLQCHCNVSLKFDQNLCPGDWGFTKLQILKIYSEAAGGGGGGGDL